MRRCPAWRICEINNPCTHKQPHEWIEDECDNECKLFYNDIPQDKVMLLRMHIEHRCVDAGDHVVLLEGCEDIGEEDS